MRATRRQFLRNSGTAAGVLLASTVFPWPFRKLSQAEAAEIINYSGGSWVPSCCNMCGGQCGVLAFVKDGRVRKIEPHDGNPNNIANVSDFFTAAVAAGDTGRLCCKGNSAIPSLYDPDRLRTPLKRVGPRGSGQFQPITWDEAIQETARRFLDIKNRYGARAISWIGEDHSFTHIQQDFTDAIGCPNYSNHANLCDTGRKAHYKATIGDERPLADIEGADYLLVFGWNFLSAIKWIHLAAIFTRARQNNPNFRFAYVDPVFNTTSSKADLWIAPRPGTDGALALAVCKLLIDNNTYDTAFVSNFTFGFDAFREYLDGVGGNAPAKTAAWAAAETGVPEATIVQLATELGAAFTAGRKICIDTWSGPGHHTNATQGGRAINALNLLLGAVDRPGTLMHPLRNGPGRRSVAGWPAKDGWRLDGRDDVTIKEDVVSDRLLATADDVKYVNNTATTVVLIPKGTTYPAGTTIPGASTVYPADAQDGTLVGKPIGIKFPKKYSFSHGSGIYCETRDCMLTQRDFLGIPYPTRAAVFVFQNFLMSTPNTQKNLDAVQEMEFVLSVDTHLSETAMLADIVVPGSHYLERIDFNATWVTFRSLGLRQQVVPSWIGGMTETQFLLEVGAAMGLPGFKTDPGLNDSDENYSKEEWTRFMATGNSGAPWNNQMTWDQLKASGVWMETFGTSTGGTKLEKWNATATFAAGDTVGSAVAGTQTVYVVRGSTGTAKGIATGPTMTVGDTYRKGFNTDTRRAQFFNLTMNAYFTGARRAGGALVQNDTRYHPLPFYRPPEDGPTSQYPLYFISWKEVEHTHTRTQNNAWLSEMRPDNRLFIHPSVAGANIQEDDWVYVQTAYGLIKARAHLTTGIQPQTVGFVRGFGHWALGKVAKGKGAHDGWLLSGKAEVHSGQAVHKEVACRVYKAI